jgi:hypothetical protein
VVTLTVGIVGHVDRAHQVADLIQSLGGRGRASMDDGTLGVYGNHRRALQASLWQTGASHTLILEDDALPVPTLLDDAATLAAERPDHLIGLYVGQLYPAPLQAVIRYAIRRADQTGAHWLPLATDTLRWAVGYVVPIMDIPAMLDRADQLVSIPADRRLGDWHGSRGRVSYSWPSLVDHADGERLHRESPPRRPGRVAWRTGSLDRTRVAIE